MTRFMVLLCAMLTGSACAQQQPPVSNRLQETLYPYRDKSGKFGYADENLHIGTFVNGFAQQSLAEAKAPIQIVRDLYFKTSDHTIDAVTDYNGHPEFWTVGQPDAYTQSFRITWYQEDQLCTEIYLLKDGSLVYALEEIKGMPLNHYTQSVWRCEYFIKDDKVIDYTSLGHGKTEDDAWELESILVQFRKRKAELEKIRK